ncbi:Protein of unknown function [Draconibacterium orientale]|uniref:Uncharacterized protein n=1 Tax=Draconibacterium orientale TaxID=1168034 RepID=X5DLN4_9BACT|nr:DUF3795 domain-containing protein [Draconibacterium orientale]AHW62159.1 hypothetical protein FH5T_16290 [Draconibacterium orientale]SET78550.1 Protein of unknown function [Draconibacterium orientale]
MTNQSNRRQFIRNSSVTGCAILLSGKLSAFTFPQDELPNPKKLNYCGYTCPADCQFLEASEKNDVELKKKVYAEWQIEEQYGIAFDAEKIFCFGCKNSDKPAGVLLSNCTVRACAIDKQYDSCIQCKQLIDCDKNLWKRFPDFHKSVIAMQEKYLAG